MMDHSESIENIQIASPRLKILRNFLYFCLGAILLFGGAVFFLEKGKDILSLDALGVFKVEVMDVESQWPIEEKEIRAWLSPVMQKSLLSIRTEKVGKELLAKPWVKDVVVRKLFPNRLFVRVRTKQARALLLTAGRVYFVDEQGQLIERATQAQLSRIDLTIISAQEETRWLARDEERVAALKLEQDLSAAFAPRYRLSQLVLGPANFFRVYLVQPPLELIFSRENWESQMPHVLKFLINPPSDFKRIKTANFIFPKKAVVRSSKSN